MDERLTRVVVLSVLGVWIANFVARFVFPNYEPSAQIDAIFMAIVGGAVAFNRNKGGGGKEGGDGES